MFPINRSSQAIQLSNQSNDLPAFYGLPSKIKYCQICTLSNQRPASAVEFQHDSTTKKITVPITDGICDACKIHKLKYTSIDWDQRELELRELCNKYRRNDGSHDCIVPGSGGKDSIKAAHLLKHKYGMNPLTVTWAPHIYTPWGWDNLQAWIHSGFDNVLYTPNGLVHSLLTRISLETLLHPFQPFIIGQKVLGPLMAMKFDIPLVFWGEPEAEDGNPIAEYGQSNQDNKYFASTNSLDNYLSGVPISQLIEDYGLSLNDLDVYLPLDPNLLSEKSIDIRYIGYYERWHPQANYYYSAQNSDFKAAPERTAGTYGKYSGIDDKLDDFHYYTTFIKFGIGRATYDSAQEVRNDDLTRQEGIDLIKLYDGEFPSRFAKECFSYMSVDKILLPKAASNFIQPEIDRQYFDQLCDSFRSPHLWTKDSTSIWKLRAPIYDF